MKHCFRFAFPRGICCGSKFYFLEVKNVSDFAFQNNFASAANASVFVPQGTILGKKTCFPDNVCGDLQMLQGSGGLAEANSSQISRAKDMSWKPILLLENKKKMFLPRVKNIFASRTRTLPCFYQFSHLHKSDVD